MAWSGVITLYPRSYPQSGRNPPELAGTHRSNRTQPEPTGRLPRFWCAVGQRFIRIRPRASGSCRPRAATSQVGRRSQSSEVTDTRVMSGLEARVGIETLAAD